MLGSIYSLSASSVAKAVENKSLLIILTSKDLPRTLSSSSWIICSFWSPPLRSEDGMLLWVRSWLSAQLFGRQCGFGRQLVLFGSQKIYEQMLSGKNHMFAVQRKDKSLE